MGELRHAQHEEAQPPRRAHRLQPGSFSLMCELNELRDLPHHSRRKARRQCIQVSATNSEQALQNIQGFEAWRPGFGI